MKKFCFILILILVPCMLLAGSLQQAYMNAAPGLNYDKLVILDPDSIYTGGLNIMDESVGIKGNGAIIDLAGDSIAASGSSQLDLDACVLINGTSALSLTGTSSSLVTHCTFYNNQNGIRCFNHSGMIEVMNSILAQNSHYGFACSETSVSILHYLDAYNNLLGNYVEWCPG